jgi:inhibitor of KinA sporulation pathway (predicted exonuclease)
MSSLLQNLISTMDAKAEEMEIIYKQISDYAAYIDHLEEEMCKAALEMEEMKEMAKVAMEQEQGDIEQDILEEEIEAELEHFDIEVQPKQHKSKKDILTVYQALKSQKSSKNHKLKPRTVKRDRTKTPEKKALSKAVRVSHA